MSVYQDFNSIPALPVELDFDPVREPLIHNGRRVDGHHAIINPLTDEVMCVSKRQHNPVNFSRMWDAFREGIDSSGIDTSQVQVKFNRAKGNSAYSVDILFKKYEFEPAVGDLHSMRFRLYDSHDMTFKHHIQCGLFRYWCSNGQASIAENLQAKVKHTMMADPEKLGAVVADWPARLEDEAGMYQDMMNTPVSKELAVEFIRKEVATYRVASGIKINEKMVEEGARIWNMYGNLGDTGYRLFNVMTHIGTHVTGREGTDLARKQARVEQNVQEIISRPAFKTLVGIAA